MEEDLNGIERKKLQLLAAQGITVDGTPKIKEQTQSTRRPTHSTPKRRGRKRSQNRKQRDRVPQHADSEHTHANTHTDMDIDDDTHSIASHTSVTSPARSRTPIREKQTEADTHARVTRSLSRNSPSLLVPFRSQSVRRSLSRALSLTHADFALSVSDSLHNAIKVKTEPGAEETEIKVKTEPGTESNTEAANTAHTAHTPHVSGKPRAKPTHLSRELANLRAGSKADDQRRQQRKRASESPESNAQTRGENDNNNESDSEEDNAWNWFPAMSQEAKADKLKMAKHFPKLRFDSIDTDFDDVVEVKKQRKTTASRKRRRSSETDRDTHCDDHAIGKREQVEGVKVKVEEGVGVESENTEKETDSQTPSAKKRRSSKKESARNGSGETEPTEVVCPSCGLLVCAV